MRTLEQARRLLAAGRPAAAERICRELLQEGGRGLPAARAPVLAVLALALEARSRFAEALVLQRRVARLAGDAENWFVLGGMASRAGEAAEAQAAWREALRCHPGHPLAACALAAALAKTGRHDDAETVLSSARMLYPDDPLMTRTLGRLYGLGGRLEAAEQELQRAVALAPEDALAHYHLGLVRRDRGAIVEAVASLTRAVALMPDNAAIHADLGQMHMLLGDFPAGFQQMEWRHSNCNRGVVLPSLSLDQTPRRLTVVCEQGAGDTLQFCRYLPVLHRLGFAVELVCPPALAGLLGDLPGVARICPLSPNPAEAWPDGAVGLLSLPYWLGTTRETIPDTVPYLTAPFRPVAEKVVREGALAAGLVWAGNPEHENDRRRSCALDVLRPCLDLPGFRFHSLQVGAAARAMAACPPSPAGAIIDLAPHLADFADTAAAVARLDVVITVDTAVAHLAGALGRPVFTLLPHVPDWRWMLHRADTPWYPTMRLFRQPFPDDWTGCITQVAAALKALAVPGADSAGHRDFAWQ